MKLCPKCQEELSSQMMGTVEVDQCGKCKGVWFEKGELRAAKDAADADLKWMDFEIWKHPDRFEAKVSERLCPVCRQACHALQYGDTGVEVDYCAQCDGVWLDEGGFEKIIGSLEEELLSKSFSDYVKESVAEAKEIVTGPESFMSEWKDFSTVLRMMAMRLFAERPKLLQKIEWLQRNNPIR